MNTADGKLSDPSGPGAGLRRRTYAVPRLVPLEALRDVTLGPTLGTGESGTGGGSYRRHGTAPQPIDPSRDRLPPLP